MGTPITLSEVGRCFVFKTQLNVDLEELPEEISFFEWPKIIVNVQWAFFYWLKSFYCPYLGKLWPQLNDSEQWVGLSFELNHQSLVWIEYLVSNVESITELNNLLEKIPLFTWLYMILLIFLLSNLNIFFIFSTKRNQKSCFFFMFLLVTINSCTDF